MIERSSRVYWGTFCSRLLVFLCFLAAPAFGQTAEDVEKRIAALPPEQQAYERFRFWVTTLPPDQRGADLPSRYVEYLKRRGYSDADASAQFRLVEAQGSRLEVERWNQILTAPNPAFNTKPNEFLMEMTKSRKPGTALDVGMGQGRNAIWLAQQGWDVTGFDPAGRAVALAVENARKLGVALKTEVKGSEDFDFGEARWDMIVLSYVGGRDMTDILERALKPGGVLVIEGFHRDADKGEIHRRSRRFRYRRTAETLPRPSRRPLRRAGHRRRLRPAGKCPRGALLRSAA